MAAAEPTWVSRQPLGCMGTDEGYRYPSNLIFVRVYEGAGTAAAAAASVRTAPAASYRRGLTKNPPSQRRPSFISRVVDVNEDPWKKRHGLARREVASVLLDHIQLFYYPSDQPQRRSRHSIYSWIPQ
jgi:hypothetical protein